MIVSLCECSLSSVIGIRDLTREEELLSAPSADLELTRDRSLEEVRLVANDISAFAFAGELWEMLLEFVDDVCRLLLRLPFALVASMIASSCRLKSSRASKDSNVAGPIWGSCCTCSSSGIPSATPCSATSNSLDSMFVLLGFSEPFSSLKPLGFAVGDFPFFCGDNISCSSVDALDDLVTLLPVVTTGRFNLGLNVCGYMASSTLSFFSWQTYSQ